MLFSIAPSAQMVGNSNSEWLTDDLNLYSTFLDLIKANKRQVQKSQHEIQRELLSLDRQERETLAEIKKLAAKGQVRKSISSRLMHMSEPQRPHGRWKLCLRIFSVQIPFECESFERHKTRFKISNGLRLVCGVGVSRMLPCVCWRNRW